MEGERDNHHTRKETREAPEEGEEKRREENLPCLALPLEGVRFGAELDGRHGAQVQLAGPRRRRNGSRESRGGAEQSTQGTSRARASTRPPTTPEVSHAMGVLPGPELALSLSLSLSAGEGGEGRGGERCNPAFGQHSSKSDLNPTTPAQETTNAGGS